MVVNRKQPIVPPMPISRSASSQPVLTKQRARITDTVNTVRAGPAPSTQKHTAPPFAPRKPKSQKISAKKRKSFVDYLFITALSFFTVYAYYTCRQSSSSHSLYRTGPPLCRALSTYRTHVLEPFVLPPIKYTLSYTQRVSEPYIVDARARLAPYFEPARRTINILSPYIKFTRRTAQKLWRNTFIPLYTDTLKPYYDTALVPRYNRYIQPQLDPLLAKAEDYFAYYVSNPIRAQTNIVLRNLLRFYIFHVDPHVREVQPHIRTISKGITDLARELSRTYSNHVRPLLLKTWARVHLITCTVWRQLMVLITRLSNALVAFFKKAVKEAGAARRQYVDPHVDRMFEQVDSKGNVLVKSDETQILPTTSISLANDLPDTSQHEGTQTAVPVSEPQPTTEMVAPVMPTLATWTGEETYPRETSSVTVLVSESLVTRTALKDATLDQKAQATLVVEETSVEHENEKEVRDRARPETKSTLAASTGLITTESVETHIPPSADSGCPACVADVTVVSTPAPLNQDEHDAELDEFLRDLGMSEQSSVAPNLSNEGVEILDENPVIAQVKSEEELLAEIAAKRADIVGRHEQWFDRLHAGVTEKGVELVKTLQTLRDNAAEEVKRMGRAEGTDGDKLKDTKSLTGVEQDGEKLLKGLDGYLRKAEARCADWKIPKDAPEEEEAEKVKQDLASRERNIFADILSKVDNKFSDRVNSARQDVRQWYVELRDREGQEVLSVSQTIKNLASRAQEDLAMDYAWLDDVTYLDWQRYHDLMRIHDKFDVTVRQIANGTSTDPEPPSDSVIPALDELDKELQDIILGFNYAMSGIRSHGLKIFGLRPLTDDGHDEERDGFFVVRDNEKRVVDLRGVDLGKIELKKEAVGVLPVKEESTTTREGSIGILPVPDIQQPEDRKAGFDASKVIIGKDKVQIEQALKDIPFEPAAQRHEEL